MKSMKSLLGVLFAGLLLGICASLVIPGMASAGQGDPCAWECGTMDICASDPYCASLNPRQDMLYICYRENISNCQGTWTCGCQEQGCSVICSII